MKRFFCGVMLAVAGVGTPVVAEIPLLPGQYVTYEARWGMMPVAEARFTGRPDTAHSNQWIMSLDLQSRGLVEKIYPIHSWFWSVQQISPWKSLYYGEKRMDNHRYSENLTALDYKSKKGSYSRDGKAIKDFDFPSDMMDDFGSIIYRLAGMDWHERGTVTSYLQDYGNIIKIEARVDGFADEAAERAGIGKRKCFIVLARPVYADENKNRQGRYVKAWVTADDQRLPLRLDMKIKFGTFRLLLIESGVEKAGVAGH